MNYLFSIKNNKKNKAFFLLILFFISFIFRMPTLFNDYYDADELAAIVQTYEYLAGDLPGRDFSESKLPLYHAIFKAAYSISYEYGFVIVHIITIIIVYLTSVFIYLIGLKLRSFEAGILGALFYSILISSFNRFFMATNGEIIYNLPITAGLFFLINFLSSAGTKSIIPFLLSLAMGFGAIGVKFHGLIFLLFFIFFFVFYYPYYKNTLTGRYLLMLTLILSLIVLLFIIDLYSTRYFAPKIISSVGKKIYYATIRGLNPMIFIFKFIHRQGMLILWHFVLWIPIGVYLVSFIKNKFRSDTLEESSIVVLFLFTYFLIFAGGIRLYFHYFMAVYPTLCILSSLALTKIDNRKIRYIKQRLMILLLIPSLFFFLWNVKDIALKHFFPEGFYNEGKILYWTRAALVGSLNHYLLPEPSYKDVCEYIEKITVPGDRIFVWGDGPYLYYFSKRRMGGTTLWPKNTIARIKHLYEKGDNLSITKAENIEKGLIDTIERKKPALFIDTSDNGLTNFHYTPTPLVEKYIKDHYSLFNIVSKMKIYKKN